KNFSNKKGMVCMSNIMWVYAIGLGFYGGIIYLLVLVARALLKYIRTGEVRKEKLETKKCLGELIRQNRLDHHMTQEFVAEALGVSRQAVSKWENGTSDPSTSNLLAIAKLFDISAEELIKQIQ
ncbi:MAG: helix-turn-helix transcriptional regulator, partial [bacterium]